jgi:hypothetical protein
MAQPTLTPPEQSPYDREDPDHPRYENPDLGPGHDKAAGNPSDPRGDSSAASKGELKNAEGGGGFYNPNGSGSAAASAGALKDSEDGEDDGGLYNPGDNKKQKGKGRFRITRRRGAILGLGTTGIISALFAFFSISSGPLEFVHIAQLMEQFHFSNQEDGEASRLMKIARYIHDPDKPQNTRLGIVGNAVADNLEGKINDATGLSSDYNTASGRFLGYTVDRDHPNFKGLSDDEIKAKLINQYGLDESSITVSGDIINVNPDTTRTLDPRGYFRQTSFARGLLGEAGLNKVSSWAGARVLSERAGWSFHPISNTDQAYREWVAENSKAAYDKLKEHFSDQEETNIDSDTTAPLPAGEDPDGAKTDNPTNDPGNGEAGEAGGSVKADPSESNIGGKIAGGGTALVGVACVMKGIDDNIPKLREAKVLLPMMKLAGQFINLGSQVQSGQDIDSTQLGFYKQFLDGTNSQGQTTSTWNQAQSIQAELGQPQTGTDIPKAAQVFNAGVPFGFLNSIPGLGTTCSILGSPIGIIGSVIIAPFATLFQSVAIKPILSDITGSLSNWLSGTPIDIFKGAGAVDGGYIDYGARLSANEQFASAGGTQLSSSDESNLNNTTVALSNSQFRSKSLAYRIFNPADNRTLVAKLMDDAGGNGPTTEFANLLHGFGDIFATALKLPSSLFATTVHAASQPYDYHDLQAVGFTPDDLVNPDYDNPFANACNVTGGQGCPNATGILGSPTSPSPSLIGASGSVLDDIKTCFGDSVSYDASQGNGGEWTINYTANNMPIDMNNGSTYASTNCSNSNPSWTRVRFWILDTQTIEGYDCSQGNSSTSDQSCQDVGFSGGSSSGSPTTTTPTTPTTPTTTAGATIDMAHLYDDSSNVACAPGTTDIGIHDGYHDNQKINIRLCAIPNMPSQGEESTPGDQYFIAGAEGKCILNSRVSGAVYAMAQAGKQAGIDMTVDSCYRSMAHQQALWVQYGMDPELVAAPGTSNHQMGLAMDFVGVGDHPSPGSGPVWDWLVANAAKFSYKNYPQEAWHWSPTGD